MIKGISSSSPYIQITGGQALNTYINSYNSALNVGNLRFNPTTQTMEVYDGTTWMQVYNAQADIRLSPVVEDLLTWMIKFKLDYEHEIKLRQESQAVKNAWEQYQVIKTLAQKEEENVI